MLPNLQCKYSEDDIFEVEDKSLKTLKFLILEIFRLCGMLPTTQTDINHQADITLPESHPGGTLPALPVVGTVTGSCCQLAIQLVATQVQPS